MRRSIMPMQPTVDEVRPSWRDLYPVHPCADVYPMMSDEEIDALAADIKANGLRANVVRYRDGDETFILDGRNRLEALARIGVEFQTTNVRWPGRGVVEIFCTKDVADPAAFVISANIHRRHLTKTQQADLILRTIEAGRNDVANMARSFNPIPGE